MESEEELVVDGFASQISKTLYQYQQQRYLCDVVIITSNGYVPAHRVVLVASSIYFSEIESSRNYLLSADSNFYLGEDKDDVQVILKLLYTGRFSVTRYNIHRLFKICSFLKLDDALEVCEEYMNKVGLPIPGRVTPPFLTSSNSFDSGQHADPGHVTDNRKKPMITEKSKNAHTASEPSITASVNNNMDTTQKKLGEQENEKHDDIKENISYSDTDDGLDGESSNDDASDTQKSSTDDQKPVVEKIRFPLNWKMRIAQTPSSQDSTSLPAPEEKDCASDEDYDNQNRNDNSMETDSALYTAISTEIQQMLDDTTAKRLNCRKCKLVFKDREELIDHRKEKHPGNLKKEKYTCDICHSKQNSWLTLVDHKFKRHNVPYDMERYKLYKCEFDDCEFTSIVHYKYKEHVDSVHGNKEMYVCEICGKECRTKAQIKYHKRSHSDKPEESAVCSICGKTCTSLQNLKRHVKSIHYKNGKKYLCHLCPYSCQGNGDLNNHLLKIHNVPLPKKCKIYRCDKCDYYTLNRSCYTRHEMLHEGTERIFKCSVCGKGFYNQHNVKAHEKRHLAETMTCPFEGCDYFTKFKHLMKNHVTGMHTNVNFKPYKCHVCDYSCKLKGNLNKHLINKHGLEVMTQVKQRRMAMETGSGFKQLLKTCAKSRIQADLPNYDDEDDNRFRVQTVPGEEGIVMDVAHLDSFERDHPYSDLQEEDCGKYSVQNLDKVEPSDCVKELDLSAMATDQCNEKLVM